jgi:hypothetical protein
MSAAPEPPFFVALVSGGMAGVAVDVSLFPLDTLKVRFLCCSFTISFCLAAIHFLMKFRQTIYNNKQQQQQQNLTISLFSHSLLLLFTTSTTRLVSRHRKVS